MNSGKVGPGISHTIQITSLFFCWPAYFTQSFTRMKCSGLELNTFYFFSRSNIEIVFNGF